MEPSLNTYRPKISLFEGCRPVCEGNARQVPGNRPWNTASQPHPLQEASLAFMSWSTRSPTLYCTTRTERKKALPLAFEHAHFFVARAGLEFEPGRGLYQLFVTPTLPNTPRFLRGCFLLSKYTEVDDTAHGNKANRQARIALTPRKSIPVCASRATEQLGRVSTQTFSSLHASAIGQGHESQNIFRYVPSLYRAKANTSLGFGRVRYLVVFRP